MAVGDLAGPGELVLLGVELVEEAAVIGYSEVAFLEAPERIVGFLEGMGLYRWADTGCPYVYLSLTFS